MRSRLIFPVGAILSVLLLGMSPVPAQRLPDLADVAYGRHERQVLDLWRADSDGPTPLVVFIHGGGFRSGDKDKYGESDLVNELLEAGISVMAINYRLIPEAVYPDPYMDAARAVQTARHLAGEWNIDPDRIAVFGTSAGGCISLWLAFHDDLAEPDSADPVARQSTRLACVSIASTPVTFDHDLVRETVGEEMIGHGIFKSGFFGLSWEEIQSPKGQARLQEASPMSWLSPNDPPVQAIYGGPHEAIGIRLTMSEAVHHYQFGVLLKRKMDGIGVPCSLYHRDELKDVTNTQVDFLKDCLLRKSP